MVKNQLLKTLGFWREKSISWSRTFGITSIETLQWVLNGRSRPSVSFAYLLIYNLSFPVWSNIAPMLFCEVHTYIQAYAYMYVHMHIRQHLEFKICRILSLLYLFWLRLKMLTFRWVVQINQITFSVILCKRLTDCHAHITIVIITL